MLNVDEFAQLSNQGVPRVEFCNRLMQRLVETTGAEAAVLWNCSDAKFRPVSQHLVEPTFQLKMSESDHTRMLSQVVTSKRSILLRPETPQATVDSTRMIGKQPPMILLAPLPNPSYEVIELIVPTRTGGDQELMSTLQQAAEIASTDGKGVPDIGGDSGAFGSAAFDLFALSKFVHGIHRSLDRKTTTSNVANEARLLIDCDRVAVVTRQRGKFGIASISSQASVNRRSNTVRLLEKLARLTLKTEKEFWYPNEEELPRQLRSAVDEYLLISTTRSLVIKPVFEKVEPLVEDPESSERSGNRVIGGLIFEQCNEQWDRARLAANLDFVHEHASDALRNSEQHSSLFLYPVWKLLSKSKVLTAPRVFPKSLLALTAAVVICLFLSFYRVPFYIHASGVLVPQQRAWIYAGQSGDIQEVFVEHADVVKEDQVVAAMSNRQLELSIAETEGRIDVLSQRQKEVEKQRFSIAGQDVNRANVDNNINSIKAEVTALRNKLALQYELLERNRLQSPIAGQVLSWDVKQKLIGRTVRPEQQLIEVADVQGPWILEIDVPDRRAGHLLRGIKDAKGGSLTVQFTLAAEPDRMYEGFVTNVASAIHIADDDQQVIRVEVAIDKQDLSVQQAGTGVTAKIYTGEETSIGFLWLHDLAEAYYRYISFYFAR